MIDMSVILAVSQFIAAGNVLGILLFLIPGFLRGRLL